MELKEIKDTIFELTHIKDEEGNDVPHFCFATDISTDTEETEEEIATIAAKEGYSIYKVFPGETMVGGLVILADGASIDLVKDMYDNFYGEAPEIAKMELNDDEKLVEAEPLEESLHRLATDGGTAIYEADSAYQLKNLLEKGNNSYRIFLWKNAYYFCDARGTLTHLQMMEYLTDKGYIIGDEFDKYIETDATSDSSFMLFTQKNFDTDDFYYNTGLGEDYYYDCRVYDFGIMFVRDTEAYNNSLIKALGQPEREVHYNYDEIIINKNGKITVIKLDDLDYDFEPNTALTMRLMEAIDKKIQVRDNPNIEEEAEKASFQTEIQSLEDKIRGALEHSGSQIRLFELEDGDNTDWCTERFDDESIDFGHLICYDVDKKERMDGRPVASFMITGGENGSGDWDNYLDDLRQVFNKLRDETGYYPLLYKVETDICDDVWNGYVLMYDKAEYDLDEAVNKLAEALLEKKKKVNKSLEEKIVKKGSKWQVQSEDGTKNLGTYDTKAEAENRLKQVHYFKHIKEDIEAEVDDEIISDFDRFGDIEAFKKKYEDTARKLGASIEFKTLVGPYRLDSFWYGDEAIAIIHYGDYTIDIYGVNDEASILLTDDTELVGLEELERYGIFNDATFPSDYTDVTTPCIEFSIKNDKDGVWYQSYVDLDYDSMWDLISALDIDFYINSVIPVFSERLNESKKKAVKARDPNAQAMWGRTRHRVEMPKKGKGSFKRHSKHRLGEEADLEEAKKKKDNELKARARKHKKSDKKGAIGWFVHPNVETSIQAFNHAMGSADAPSTITAPAGLGEDITEEPIKESDLVDFDYKLITDYRTQGYFRDSEGYPIKSYYYNKVPETCYVVEKDDYLQDTLLRKRKNRRVLNGVKDFFAAHPKSKYCVISAWDISRDGSTRPINTYRVLAANNISDYFVLRNKRFPKDSVIYSSTEKNTAIKEYYSKERNIGWELVQINEGKETKLYPNPEEDMLEAVEKHDTLNPKLWDEDNNLKPEVREKILEIVKEFTDTLEEDEIKFKIKDIVLVGSNCSYTYNEMSDLDIHIRMDTKSLECPDNLYPLLYSAYRSLFNKKFDIDFYGIPVELYIETDDTEQMSEQPIDN